MIKELEWLSEEACTCLDIAVPIAAQTGVDVTSIAELVQHIRRIQLPSPVESMKLRASASEALTTVRSFLTAGAKLRYTDLPIEACAAIFDIGGADALMKMHAKFKEAWSWCGINTFDNTADPRTQLIASMIASAFDVWLDCHEEPVDFDFIYTDEGLSPKPDTALALAVMVIGVVHDVDVEEIRACLPAAKHAIDDDFLATWDAAAMKGQAADPPSPHLRLVH